MTDYKATPEQWQTDAARWLDAIVELRDRVQVLEDATKKHIVETSSNIGALFRRIESLEAAERQASKVYEISKPLKLTAKQQQELNALLRPVTSQPSPNSSQIGSSLVERVGAAIFEQFENNAGNEAEARAAIREVAAWLDENTGGHAAWMLTQDADRG
jgi:hypothetical protein